MRHSKLVGAVSNPDTSGSRESGQAVSTYHGPYAVRLQTAPTEVESILLFRTYTVERSKHCSSAIHRREAPLPTPDKSPMNRD